MHTLFDKGCVTVTSDHHLEVSKQIHEKFDNGQEYYALHGRGIFVPLRIALRPAGENLAWHNENVFEG
jgi:putative restriction endonuclease